MQLDVRGIPERSLADSLRLQLVQLSGLKQVGFAYRVIDQKASVWYWDENKIDRNKLLTDGKGKSRKEIAPWPEAILRANLSEGLHLIRLEQGFEALSIKKGHIYKTRWFAQQPNQDAWVNFARDAGHTPEDGLPAPTVARRLGHPPEGWRLRTSLLTRTPRKLLFGAIGIALLGSMIVTGLVYQFKLQLAIATEREMVAKISSENANTIAVQKEIDQIISYLSLLQQARPRIVQLELMRELAESGLINAESTVSLLEWEFRNNQLRLLFSTPGENFSMSDFLRQLDELEMLSNTRLLTDTPPRTIGIQSSLSPPEKRPTRDIDTTPESRTGSTATGVKP